MSDEEADAEEQVDSIKVFKATCIQALGLKGPWLPAVQAVAGREYIQLSKWDRRLTQLATGQPLNLHTAAKKPLNNINVRWFEVMAGLRLDACSASLRQVIRQAAEAEGVAKPQKIRQVTDQDKFLCGQTVSVEAPAVLSKDTGDELRPPLQMRVLFAVRGDIWIELTAANLEYIRDAIRESEPYEQPVSKRAKTIRGSPKKRRKRGRKPKDDGDNLPVLEGGEGAAARDALDDDGLDE